MMGETGIGAAGGVTDGGADRLLIGTRRYSSWSLRGWLPVRLAGLDVVDVMIPLAGGHTDAVGWMTPSGTVPVLDHDGIRIHDSLAIGEYCAEHAPGLWPADRRARAVARAIVAEMHGGFRPLRLALPMNLGRTGRARATPLAPDVTAGIARICSLWRETRARYAHGGGPFLFGEAFTLADVAYAPVVTRFLSYGVETDAASRDYCAAVRAHPLVERWYADAAAEPEDTRIAATEQLD